MGDGDRFCAKGDPRDIRKAIRDSYTKPPNDFGDDISTELAFRCAELESALATTLEREKVLREAAQGILDIGKRDMSNPKYNIYFAALKAALKLT